MPAAKAQVSSQKPALVKHIVLCLGGDVPTEPSCLHVNVLVYALYAVAQQLL